MNTQDNAKIIETVERQTIFNYFEKLANAAIKKYTLFSIFPYTAAANLSDPHHFFLIEDIEKLSSLLGGNSRN